MKKVLLTFLLFLSVTIYSNATTITAVVNNGPANTNGTWDLNRKPTATDDVVIPNGIAVIISSTTAFLGKTLTLQGTGSLVFQNGSNYTMTISGDVTIGSSAQIIGTNGGTKAHSLTIGGNLINAGVFNCTPGGSVMNVTFNKAGGASISGSGTTALNAITIAVGAGNLLSVSTGSSVSIAGGITLTSGKIDNSAGTIKFNGSTAQTIANNTFSGDVNNLIINNSAGVTLSQAISIIGSLTLTSGTFTSNNNVTLKSTSPTAIGSIAQITGGSITGNVTIQQYLTAQRAYRLLGHPFNSNIAISNIQPYVDITGSSAAGFTPGNASAFNYLTGVWAAYTDNTQTWNKNEALFLFVRGTPGQGIGVTDGSYTPNAAKISLTGQVNTGNLNYTVNAAGSFSDGAAQGWNAIGNPYPAPIDVNSIGGITSPGGSGASIYLWNANMGSTATGIASGGYDFRTLGSPIILPEYGAFFIKNVSGIDQPITFSESNKSTGTPLALFGAGNTPTQSFLLTIADSATYWDRLRISFDNKSTTASTDKTDLEKFSNINFDFYSLGSDNNRLAINSRPVLQSITDIIPLGIKTSQQRTFTVQASEVSLAQGNNLWLHDKYTNNWQAITNGMSYRFSVTADTASQGNNRFEVAMKASAPVVVTPAAPAQLTVEAGPNPVQSLLTIRYASPEAMQTNIRITDISGKTVSSINAGKVQSGVQQVATNAWGKGVYVVQVNNGKETVTKEIVKE